MAECDPPCISPEEERELEKRTREEEAAKAREQNECDHDWEYDDYDPSVGAFGGKTCTICGEQGPEDRGDDFDDNYF